MSELLDPAVAERVIARALANGGRFAEVFAARRHGMTMAIDESRIESVQSGAEEGAGVRVVEGGTTYFAHVDGLDPADLERAADELVLAARSVATKLEMRGDVFPFVLAGGVFRVGPQSAGADPGPACYGRGGDQPTSTDAQLLLGRLRQDRGLLGGDMSLDVELASTAMPNPISYASESPPRYVE